MERLDEELLAPGRGQHDRLLPRLERSQQQRRRLLRAVAISFSQPAGATVQSVVKAAGVSRNTFYEHFANIEQALAESAQFAGGLLEDALVLRLEAERTPVARFRALVSECFAWLRREQAWVEILGWKPTANGAATNLTELGRALQKTLLSCLESAWRDMRLQGNVHPVRLVAAVVALEELLRLYAHAKIEPDVEDEIVAVLVGLFH